MFVHLITVSVFFLFILYNKIIGCTSYWEFLYVSPMYGLFFQCIFVKFIFLFSLMLYIWLLRYVFVLHTIFSLFDPHLGNLVMYISCILFIVPLSPSSFTYIHNSGLTHICLD